jgi:hypothetical protein
MALGKLVNWWIGELVNWEIRAKIEAGQPLFCPRFPVDSEAFRTLSSRDTPQRTDDRRYRTLIVPEAHL